MLRYVLPCFLFLLILSTQHNVYSQELPIITRDNITTVIELPSFGYGSATGIVWTEQRIHVQTDNGVLAYNPVKPEDFPEYIGESLSPETPPANGALVTLSQWVMDPNDNSVVFTPITVTLGRDSMTLQQLGWVRHAILSPSGTKLLGITSPLGMGGENTPTILWDIETSKVIWEAYVPFDAFDAAFNPDETQIALLSADSTITLLDATGQQTTSIKGFNGFMSSFRLSKDGTRIVTSGNPTTLWDFENGQPLAYLPQTHGFDITDKTQRIVLADEEGLYTYTLSGELLQTIPANFGYVTALDVDSNEIYAAIGTNSGVWLFDLSRNQLVDSPLLHMIKQNTSGLTTEVNFSPDGNLLAVAVFDARTDKNLLFDLIANTSQELSGAPVAFSPDGTQLVLVDYFWAQPMRVWDVKNAEIRFTLPSTDLDADFNTDGRLLVSSGLKVWDMTDGTLLHSIPFAQSALGGLDIVRFSSDGTRILTALHDLPYGAKEQAQIDKIRLFGIAP